jgi:hypothetical protein
MPEWGIPCLVTNEAREPERSRFDTQPTINLALLQVSPHCRSAGSISRVPVGRLNRPYENSIVVSVKRNDAEVVLIAMSLILGVDSNLIRFGAVMVLS